MKNIFCSVQFLYNWLLRGCVSCSPLLLINIVFSDGEASVLWKEVPTGEVG
jgi:hypothetical protein